MFELRPLSEGAIPGALAKAERYRLLNESGQAESICLDVLAADPDNQDALATLILAITDQFRDEGTAAHVSRAERLLPQLMDPYGRAYYGALINERRARGLWMALPGEINRWWRNRRQMTLVADGAQWYVEGPDAERARVAYASLGKNGVEYSLSPPAQAALFA